MDTRRQTAMGVAAFTLWLAAAPLAWAVALAHWLPSEPLASPSYLPAAEVRRVREPWDPKLLDDLKAQDPGAVIIGDSMAGRVDPVRLGELIDHRPVATLVAPATGSGWWYLAFKNVVVASGIKPKWVIVFLRDTNLTDPMFRLLEPYRQKLDAVAHDLEPELNDVVGQHVDGPWYRVHVVAERLYGIASVRRWIEPRITLWLARLATGNRQKHALLDDMNEAFGLKHLRPIVQADMAASDDADADFAANIDRSLLPTWVSLAQQHQLRVAFIKILRRPIDGHPPPESPALQQYTKDLRAWLEGRGMVFIDDRDNPALWKLPYADGDHTDGAAMTPYAETLAAELEKIK